MCSREGRIPTLEPHKILNCNENLDSLGSQVETADSSNFSAIVSNMKILTSVPDQLTTQNISAAANIAVQIPKKPNVPEESQVSVAVTATLSQLLDANETELNHNNLVNATTSLTKTMEGFSLTGNISQHNIAIQSAPLKLSSSTMLFSAQRHTALGHYQSTKLNTQENASGLIDDLSTEVQILVNIINNSSSDNGKVGFVMYQNDKLFQSRIYESHSGFSKQIFSGNTDGGRTIGVEIAFSPKCNTSKLQLHDHACVF
ncbi:adhesion G protein-coupled receptor G7 [Columba livia]|uniref:Adhesion G protein-coupled receptor G7 n=1 Tax=Columba livia TaxID=8932 RepID=A0A2I0MT06_COLLI|nr:adhesion G protein-coupled receptor G7 [Columba livia]